ncbi:FAD-binding oxidoreductase [Butyrivibrio sp. CB08]|uniref:FAD-dependent oxidoreductase n=1 Tax=Butyrivibrio sp. CB08 TaxID=2364879 RepID=UPI000EA88B87|nr:FAD-dependent oxidoreductase [Butyrivibrio sp. CB08]RKM57856.1 FAD-binding oxidoreductase [Butyrivibrio sp. CB08]
MTGNAIEKYDRIIIGAGLYGLYAAEHCGRRGDKVLVLEYDDAPFKRATYINQARVHMGYHYPRSLSTAMKSAGYYRRFHEDYGFSILDKFKQIYATSSQFSWTNGEQFMEFCRAAGIYCRQEHQASFFKDGTVDGAFLTEEDTYDAHILRDFFVDRISDMKNVTVVYGARLQRIRKSADAYEAYYYSEMSEDKAEKCAASDFVLNATYASCNQVLGLVEGDSDDSFEAFKIKYELCEIILCKPSDDLRDYGFTVMDGPFFSIMPFGKTGFHSLTSVTFTPHVTSYDKLPSFSCQNGQKCSPSQLCNCNECPARPESAWEYMSHLADKYLLPQYSYTYDSSLFSMKPILKSSEVDDSRPTSIVVSSKGPTFISVLSGKINTVYDLDEFLDE